VRDTVAHGAAAHDYRPLPCRAILSYELHSRAQLTRSTTVARPRPGTEAPTRKPVRYRSKLMRGDANGVAPAHRAPRGAVQARCAPRLQIPPGHRTRG
jgi:hypothetical protein